MTMIFKANYQKTACSNNKIFNCLIILSFLIMISCMHTEKIVGKYKRNDNYNNCILNLKANNTYLYSCYSHMSGKRWSYGSWKVKKNIIFFAPELLYDTVRLRNKDTLIISENQTPELFNRKEIEEYNNLLYLAQSELGIFSQNIGYIFPQKKLLRKNNRLYQFNNMGKITLKYFSR